MRLWLSESERLPDPEPARADARKAALAGTIAWIAAGVVLLLTHERAQALGLEWWLWTAVIGASLGVVGLVVVQVRRR